ncbi:MAG: hypothetical protein ACUVX1_00015 [Chloroflexota bacterium]
MSEQKSFDASKYLTKLQGRDYLEVKWRLLWLRTEHPEAVVNTELVLPPSQLTGKDGESFALFKATVSIPGAGSATGWGSETAKDFRDYIEKAETKALGRALAALGFGTQFCEDFDFTTRDNGHTVDSPVDSPRSRSAAASAPSASSGPAAHGSGSLATPAQVRAIYTIARDQYAMSESQVEERSVATYGCPPTGLTKRQASEFISSLQSGNQR